MSMDLVLTWRDETTCRHFCDPWIFRPAAEGESTAQHDKRVKVFARYGFHWSDRGYVGNVGQKGRQRDPVGLVAALTKAGYRVTHKGTRIPPALVTG